MGISVTVSNLNPTPGEIVKFTGSATPVEDIILNVYDEQGTNIARYTIYLKTHGLNSIKLVPGILEAVIQTWTFHGKDTGSEAPSATITIQQEVPPELDITLSANKTIIEPDDIVTFQISTNPAATYTVKLYAYINGILEAQYSTPITDGYGTQQLKPGQLGSTVDWIVKDDYGNVSNTVTTTTQATGPAEAVLTAIRVQDVDRQLWFEYDVGAAWNPKSPEITPGTGNLYIAFYITNNGQAGTITLTIKDDDGLTLATKTETIAAGASKGIEYTGTMPDSSYNITLEFTPGSTFTIAITPLNGNGGNGGDGGIVDWWNSLSWLQKGLVATGVVAGVIVSSVGLVKLTQRRS